MGGGAIEVLPLQKKGGTGFSNPDLGGGGSTTCFEIVLTWVLEVLAILEGGTKDFHILKGQDVKKCYLVLRGGGKKLSDRDFSIL